MAGGSHSLAANSGFCREALMVWCEANRVDFVFGLARNPRLVAEIAVELLQAEAEATATGKPARRFKDFRYATLDRVAPAPGDRQGGMDRGQG